jgi:hypothetical protein
LNDDFDLLAAPCCRLGDRRRARGAQAMSRRHHGGRPHRSNGPGRPIDTSRPIDTAGRLPIASPAGETDAAARLPVAPATAVAPPDRPAPIPVAAGPDRENAEPASPMDGASDASAGRREGENGLASPEHGSELNGSRPTSSAPLGACTAPQLRRFIKSRPYVPMHELRRRFAIDGGEDDVTPVELSGHRIFVGLPPREGFLLGELLRGGEVGYELSLDPRSPIVIGLYPMRPVART